jgi:predicted nucleic acid-binding Zn ribbon protein
MKSLKPKITLPKPCIVCGKCVYENDLCSDDCYLEYHFPVKIFTVKVGVC